MDLRKTKLSANTIFSLHQAEALAGIANEFAMQDGCTKRQGALLIGGQESRCFPKYTGSSTFDLAYQPFELAIELRTSAILPNEITEVNKVYAQASEGVCALAEGKGLFKAQPNRHLDPGIYYPLPLATSSASSCSMMILEATFGRFVIVYADSYAQEPTQSSVYIHFAIAKALVELFPQDCMLSRSYAWLINIDSNADPAKIEKIETIVDTLFQRSSNDGLFKYRRHLQQYPTANQQFPFCNC